MRIKSSAAVPQLGGRGVQGDDKVGPNSVSQRDPQPGETRSAVCMPKEPNPESTLLRRSGQKKRDGCDNELHMPASLSA